MNRVKTLDHRQREMALDMWARGRSIPEIVRVVGGDHASIKAAIEHRQDVVRHEHRRAAS